MAYTPSKDVSRINLVQLVDDTGASLGVTASTTVKATAAAPTYVEGSTTNPLSTDLSGNLRVAGTINATSVMKATAAAPTYTEASTTNPVSSNLKGEQRVNDADVVAALATANGYSSTIAAAASDTTTPVPVFGSGREYETVAASQTAQSLGATGGTGDDIDGILVIPATTSPGVVTLLDNSTSIPVFVGGASSVSNLVPFFIPLGMKSVSGAWKLTTGANVSCIAIGNFT